MITGVPGHVRDLTICQALLTTSTVIPTPQCRAKADTTRDGYPCCWRHKKANRFVPWTPLALMSREDAVFVEMCDALTAIMHQWLERGVPREFLIEELIAFAVDEAELEGLSRLWFAEMVEAAFSA
jgi:hypothetical protein